MGKSKGAVYVVDDDLSVQRSLKRLLGVQGYQIEVFSSASEFMKSALLKRPSCLVLDVQLPDKNGIVLQKQMRDKKIHIPIIFITGHGDITMSVNAMKSGAVDFLPKPFSAKALFEAVERALRQDKSSYADFLKAEKVKARIQTLTPREKEVFMEVVKGKLNKQIAGDLGIALKTVKIHRGSVMKKMKVRSVIALANAAREATSNF